MKFNWLKNKDRKVFRLTCISQFTYDPNILFAGKDYPLAGGNCT